MIDPRSGQILARSFTDSWIIATRPNRRAVTIGVDSSGRRILSIVSLSIDGEAPPRS